MYTSTEQVKQFSTEPCHILSNKYIPLIQMTETFYNETGILTEFIFF